MTSAAPTPLVRLLQQAAIAAVVEARQPDTAPMERVRLTTLSTTLRAEARGLQSMEGKG